MKMYFLFFDFIYLSGFIIFAANIRTFFDIKRKLSIFSHQEGLRNHLICEISIFLVLLQPKKGKISHQQKIIT